jgi:hypothetical protein
MAQSFVMAGEKLRAAASPPAAFIKPQGRRGPSLAADSPQQQNFFYVLWEIKAPEEMLRNFVELISRALAVISFLLG